MAAKSNRPRRKHPPEDPASAKKSLLESLGLAAVDYKDTQTLRLFISERGKIRSRHVTGLTVQQQRRITRAIKNSREMALLPYPGQARCGQQRRVTQKNP
ncbi:30S ribosomal protein S18 [Mycobacterium decipiens]|uniref:Small ribosomal subunit protein bS18 n=1 Tax=Mycobacterium decipiens TaxID=1430326 RepID=A0A1X2LTT3_9MYCO|nr:30S ribosomal protein S18 [Mycobacterium decipiens]OSC40320.1 30S ribosomal protein S18 [Mycobacterium decipiens]